MSVLKKTSYRHEHVPIVIGLNLGYSWMFDPNDSLVNDAFREERKTTVNETEWSESLFEFDLIVTHQ